MKVTYIAHPIGGDIANNVQRVKAIVADLYTTKPGIIPFAPYLTALQHLDDTNPVERARGMVMNQLWFERGAIDELWLYGPTISRGMAEEIRLARRHGVRIVSKSDGTKMWPLTLPENQPK